MNSLVDEVRSVTSCAAAVSFAFDLCQLAAIIHHSTDVIQRELVNGLQSEKKTSLIVIWSEVTVMAKVFCQVKKLSSFENGTRPSLANVNARKLSWTLKFWRVCFFFTAGKSRGRWWRSLDSRRSLLRRSCTRWVSASGQRRWMRPLSVLSPVSRLTFSAKQETEINSIHQLVVGATENVKEGNEDIREVKFTKSGIRGTRHLFRRC